MSEFGEWSINPEVSAMIRRELLAVMAAVDEEMTGGEGPAGHCRRCGHLARMHRRGAGRCCARPDAAGVRCRCAYLRPQT